MERQAPRAERSGRRRRGLKAAHGEQPAIDPMDQFMIHKIVDLPPCTSAALPLDMSITNSVGDA